MTGETVYSRAADIIRERGWWDGTQWTVINERGEYTRCLVQSLADATCEGDNLCEVLGAVGEHLGGERPAAWNDAPHRTVEDVLLVLKELHVQAGGA